MVEVVRAMRGGKVYANMRANKHPEKKFADKSNEKRKPLGFLFLALTTLFL
jgi:hypothetical protein